MGKKSGPKAPDYKGAAEAEAAGSLAAINAQTQANRPDMYTPWGSSTWENQGGQWTNRISLSPQEQASLDSQMAIQQGRSGAAQELLGQATDAFSSPMDWNALPERAGPVQAGQTTQFTGDPTVSNRSFDTGRGVTGAFAFGPGNDPSGIRERAQEAVWQAQKPALDQAREGVEAQLANQGLARGSEAWNREMSRRDDAEARARLLAIDAGRAEAGQMFEQGISGVDQANRIAGQEFGQNLSAAGFGNQAGAQEFDQMMRAASLGDSQAMQRLQMQLQAGGFNNQNRQAALAEEMQRRGMPLNELNALLTGQQVNMPNMPSFQSAGAAQGPRMLDAANMGYQASLDQYNARMGGINNLMGLGSSAAFAFSDARLKEDIQSAGTSIDGVPVVHYRYRGLPARYIGVIAQDVLRVKPHAVALHPSGYLMVNYQELFS